MRCARDGRFLSPGTHVHCKGMLGFKNCCMISLVELVNREYGVSGDSILADLGVLIPGYPGTGAPMTGFLDRRQDTQIHPYMYTSVEPCNPLITRDNTDSSAVAVPLGKRALGNTPRVSVSFSCACQPCVYSTEKTTAGGGSHASS